jgi:hypothetical protein
VLGFELAMVDAAAFAGRFSPPAIVFPVEIGRGAGLDAARQDMLSQIADVERAVRQVKKDGVNLRERISKDVEPFTADKMEFLSAGIRTLEEKQRELVKESRRANKLLERAVANVPESRRPLKIILSEVRDRMAGFATEVTSTLADFILFLRALRAEHSPDATPIGEPIDSPEAWRKYSGRLLA